MIHRPSKATATSRAACTCMHNPSIPVLHVQLRTLLLYSQGLLPADPQNLLPGRDPSAEVAQASRSWTVTDDCKSSMRRKDCLALRCSRSPGHAPNVRWRCLSLLLVSSAKESMSCHTSQPVIQRMAKDGA